MKNRRRIVYFRHYRPIKNMHGICSVPLFPISPYNIWFGSASRWQSCHLSCSSIYNWRLTVRNEATLELLHAIWQDWLIRTRTRIGGGVNWPPKIRADTTCIRAKDSTFVLLTVSPNGTHINLHGIHFGWSNKGDVHRYYSMTVNKLDTAIVPYFFSP